MARIRAGGHDVRMTEAEESALRAEIEDIDQILRRLTGEAGPTAPDAARDGGDAAVELTERMEVEAQVEALRSRRQELVKRLGG